MEAPEPKPDRAPPSKTGAALSVFATASFDVDHEGLPWIVHKLAVYWPDTEFWRLLDASKQQGYGPRKLIEAIRSAAAQAAVEAELFGPAQPEP